jgi:hypothetical protein
VLLVQKEQRRCAQLKRMCLCLHNFKVTTRLIKYRIILCRFIMIWHLTFSVYTVFCVFYLQSTSTKMFSIIYILIRMNMVIINEIAHYTISKSYIRKITCLQIQHWWLYKPNYNCGT